MFLNPTFFFKFFSVYLIFSIKLNVVHFLGRARMVRRQFLALKITGSTPVAQEIFYAIVMIWIFIF